MIEVTGILAVLALSALAAMVPFLNTNLSDKNDKS